MAQFLHREKKKLDFTSFCVVKTHFERVRSLSSDIVIVLVTSTDGEYLFFFPSASFVLKSLFSSKLENPSTARQLRANDQ